MSRRGNTAHHPKRPGMEFISLPVRQITIAGKFLTMGIAYPREERLGITSGQVNVASLLGDEEMESLMLGLLLARTSLIEMDGIKRKKKSLFIYPKTFSMLDAVKLFYEYFIGSVGKASAVDVEWRAVTSVEDSFAAIDELARYDIFVDLYVDAFLDTSKTSSIYMDKLHDAKKEKFILCIRPTRKKLVVTKRADNEVIIDAKKNRNITYILRPASIREDDVMRYYGKFRVSGRDDDAPINYQFQYPYYITPFS